MGRQVLLGWPFVTLLAIVAPAAADDTPAPELQRLKDHVTTLASPDFLGRRGPGGRKAADYVVKALRDLHLEPLFDGSYTQDIPSRELGQVLGRNVGACLRGCHPDLRDEWVILSAHFDHLGVRNGQLYPGADDNASGVAMLLEVARTLAESPTKPKRSVMFLSFDLEEVGLFGSRYFAEHTPIPLERIALFVTADMIGRSLGGVCEPYVFVIGSEYAPGLRPWIAQASTERALTVALLGTDIVGTRSDYGPFRSRQIPYLFFSTGENPCYHQPTDISETVNYPKIEAISRLILGIVRRAASAETVPKWTDVPEYPFSEAVAVRDLMQILLDNREKLKIGAPQALLMKKTLRNLDAIIASGTITPAQRIGVVRVAQIVLVSVL